MPLDINHFWRDSADDSDIARADIPAWESESQVVLPAILQKLLTLRNGGYVNRCELEILSLNDIKPLEEEEREWIEWELEDEVEDYDPDRVFVFCYEHSLGGAYFLDYNRHGPQHEPLVLEYFSDPGDARFVANSVTEFLESFLTRSTEPLVNWQETEDLQTVAEESIDLSRLWGTAARIDQVLGLLEDRLMFFQREETPEGIRLSKTLLPQPLDADWARIARYRPNPLTTYTLHLQPQDTDRIVEEESIQDGDGSWKNTRNEGVPVYVLFESRSKDVLNRLKSQLF